MPDRCKGCGWTVWVNDDGYCQECADKNKYWRWILWAE